MRGGGGKKALAAESSRVFIPAKHHCLITDRSRKATKLHHTKNPLLTLRSILIISQKTVYQQDLIHH